MVVTSTRFLLVRVQFLDGRPTPTLSVLNTAIRDSVIENFGDFGSGLVLSSLQTRHYTPHAELCCVRVARQHARMVRGAISLVRFIQRQVVILTVVQICGSSRTLRRAMLSVLKEHTIHLDRGDAAARKEIERLQRDLIELQREE